MQGISRFNHKNNNIIYGLVTLKLMHPLQAQSVFHSITDKSQSWFAALGGATPPSPVMGCLVKAKIATERNHLVKDCIKMQIDKNRLVLLDRIFSCYFFFPLPFSFSASLLASLLPRHLKGAGCQFIVPGTLLRLDHRAAYHVFLLASSYAG